VQIVIAGSVAAVHRALELAKARGAKKAVLLPVSAPFHCRLMQSAQERLSQDLAHIRFQNLEVPLINNADVAELRCGAQVAESLSRQVCAPVRWTETVQKLIGLGIRVFVEVGPGKVVCGLVRQIDKTMQTAHVEDLKSLNEALAILGHQN
jgi:[acyl-carrier-protein] S-malonyltransferase